MEKTFSEQVYELVRQIPRGQVTTYGTIARMLARPQSGRYVGFAMRNAPEGLPCHRVLNQKGSLAPCDVFGSPAYQRQLLQEEGITFLPNGTVDMKAHLWSPTAGI